MNAPSPDNKLKINVYIALFITGAGMGWLIGLSVSPVVGIVITCVTGIATTLIIALSGSGDKKPNWTINPWTIAVFVIGLAVLSPVGIWVRTHEYAAVSSEEKALQTWTSLGFDSDTIQKDLYFERFPIRRYLDTSSLENIKNLLDHWEQLGISRTVATDTLFKQIYSDFPGVTNISNANERGLPIESTNTVAGLTAGSTTECANLRFWQQSQGMDIQGALTASGLQRWQILSVITDTVSLLELVDKDLCPIQNSGQ